MKTPLEFSLAAGKARFDFQFMEVPSELHGLGGKKLAALIQLEGGTRVIQTFGNVPHDRISWKGIIFGPNSFDRWRQLDGFRASSLPVTLTYGTFKLLGVLDETELLPGFEGYLPYRATFIPQADQSATNITQVPPQSIDQSANAALANAQAQAANAQNATQNAINAAAVYAAAAIAIAQQAIKQSLTTAVLNTPGAVGVAQTQVSNAAAQTFALLSTQDALSVSTYVMPLLVSLAALSNLLQSLPAQPQVTVLADGRLTNLFLLAARYFGNPNAWTSISNANGGMPPFWKGFLSVVIPNQV